MLACGLRLWKVPVHLQMRDCDAVKDRGQGAAGVCSSLYQGIAMGTPQITFSERLHLQIEDNGHMLLWIG